MMDKKIILLVILSIMLSACTSADVTSINEMQQNIEDIKDIDKLRNNEPTINPETDVDNKTSELEAELEIDIENEDEIETDLKTGLDSEVEPEAEPENTADSQIKVEYDQSKLLKTEITGLEYIRADLTRVQMDESGLEKEVNELGAETYYHDGDITYLYSDWPEEAEKHFAVIVNGKFEGPRGIAIGDTFDEVMALFPQENDCTSDDHCIFYGQLDPEGGHMYDVMTGVVSPQYGGYVDIIITTEDGFPFIRLNFENDTLSRFNIYLIPLYR